MSVPLITTSCAATALPSNRRSAACNWIPPVVALTAFTVPPSGNNKWMSPVCASASSMPPELLSASVDVPIPVPAVSATSTALPASRLMAASPLPVMLPPATSAKVPPAALPATARCPSTMSPVTVAFNACCASMAEPAPIAIPAASTTTESELTIPPSVMLTFPERAYRLVAPTTSTSVNAKPRPLVTIRSPAEVRLSAAKSSMDWRVMSSPESAPPIDMPPPALAVRRLPADNTAAVSFDAVLMSMSRPLVSVPIVSGLSGLPMLTSPPAEPFT